MRELTSNELAAVNGGHDAQEHSYQAEFWNSFLHSSGFAAGIFWSPVMPFIMGTAAVLDAMGSAIGSAIGYLFSGVANGASYVAQSTYAAVTTKTTPAATNFTPVA